MGVEQQWSYNRAAGCGNPKTLVAPGYGDIHPLGFLLLSRGKNEIKPAWAGFYQQRGALRSHFCLSVLAPHPPLSPALLWLWGKRRDTSACFHLVQAQGAWMQSDAALQNLPRLGQQADRMCGPSNSRRIWCDCQKKAPNPRG